MVEHEHKDQKMVQGGPAKSPRERIVVDVATRAKQRDDESRLTIDLPFYGSFLESIQTALDLARSAGALEPEIEGIDVAVSLESP